MMIYVIICEKISNIRDVHMNRVHLKSVKVTWPLNSVVAMGNYTFTRNNIFFITINFHMPTLDITIQFASHEPEEMDDLPGNILLKTPLRPRHDGPGATPALPTTMPPPSASIKQEH